MGVAATIAEELLQIKAIKLSPQKPFTWASGLKSPIYCDNRTILSYPEVRSKVIQHFKDASEAFRPFNCIGGVATAGIPHGALLADRLGLPFIYVRSSPKEHGRQNQIEGVLPEKARVLLVEDLISTGGSSLKAVQAVRESGAEVAGVLAIFTYGFSEATTAFNQANCLFSTLSNYPTLLERAISLKYISNSDRATLEAWRRSPRDWKAENF